MRFEHAAEVLLLEPIVLAAAGHAEMQFIAIEMNAGASVGNDDRSVIDS